MQPQLLALFLILIAAIVFAARKNKKYKEGAYYQITENSYSSIKHDKGRYAEYSIYESLRHLEDGGGRFLFNVLIPKGQDKTTEIDVLLICSKGVFVFESKNYSGWIFGNEAHKNWTQTLPKGWNGDSHKVRFYNPVMQNAAHIRHLRNLIGRNISLRSIIVFSDRCTFKDVTVTSSDVSVIHHCEVASVVERICNQAQANNYTEAEMASIYDQLVPYTQLTSEIKERHVENIKNHLN